MLYMENKPERIIKIEIQHLLKSPPNPLILYTISSQDLHFYKDFCIIIPVGDN